MRADGRRAFAAAFAALARPGGLLFLSTLSPRDPRHYAVGTPVPGEDRSWVEHVYLHFCTAEELSADFAAFDVLDLEERPYDETNARGDVHRHVNWSSRVAGKTDRLQGLGAYSFPPFRRAG